MANVALDTLKHSHLIGLQTKAGQDLPLEDDELKSTDVFKQWKSVLETSTESYRLAIGAVIANRMRKAVADQLGFSCSAGIGPNKVIFLVEIDICDSRKIFVICVIFCLYFYIAT